MCWSPEVTLAFVIIECACCAVLAARGMHCLLLGFVPLLLQEAVQYLLWRQIERDEQLGTCGAWNVRLSFLELALVAGMVPLGFALMSLRSLDRCPRLGLRSDRSLTRSLRGLSLRDEAVSFLDREASQELLLQLIEFIQSCHALFPELLLLRRGLEAWMLRKTLEV